MPKENQDTQLLHKAVAHLKEYGVNGVDQVIFVTPYKVESEQI